MNDPQSNDPQPNDMNRAPDPINRGPIDNTASYGKRFAAFMLDSLLIGMAVAIMFEYLGLGPDQAQATDMETAIKLMAAKLEALSKTQQYLLLIFPYLMFFILHGFSLFQSGQTIGKRIVGIAIVTLDNQKPAFLPLIFNRYLTQWVIGLVPGFGFLLRVADILAIFWTNKRCVHDLIAKTKVIDLKVAINVTESPNSFIA
ncbi:MAG: RDD family protein [Gammaproteobacteria bacterium]|nr:MAG: RDD family protein [Gammaproteobacteria bacterium]